MAGSTSLLITALSSTFFAGVLLALPRSLKAPLARQRGSSEGRGQRLRMLFRFALIPMMLVSGLLIDKWGLQPLLVGGALVAALGVTALEPSQTDRSTWPGVLLTAGGTAALTVASVVLLPRAFLPRNATAAINLGFIAFALGGLLAPVFLDGLERRWGFRPALLALALACLLPATLSMVLPASDLELPPPTLGVGQLLRAPSLWFAAGLLFLYQPLEESLGVWVRRYLVDLDSVGPRTSLWVGLFWLVFLAARLTTGLIVRPPYEAWLLVFLALFAAVVLGNLIGNYRRLAGEFSLLLLALSLGPILPTVLGRVLRLLPSDGGPACGVLFAFGAAGSLLLPPLLHPVSDQHAPRSAMRLGLGLLLGITCAALVVAIQ